MLTYSPLIWILIIMLKAYIENVRVYPVRGTVMEMVFTNSYFKERATKSDLTYDTAFATTDELREALGHTQDRQVPITKKKYAFHLELGTKSFSGEFYLTDYDEDAYTGYIYINQFSIDSYKKKLSEFSRPLTGTLSQQWDDAVKKQWPDTPYYMPTIINNTFYDSADTLEEDKYRPDYLGIMNGYQDFLFQNILSTQLTARNYYTACPQPCLLEILKVGFADDGLVLKGDFPNDPAARKLWIYNNKCLDEVKIKPDNLITKASNETDYIYSLKGTPAFLNFTEVDGLYFNTTTDKYTFKYAGKHKINLIVGYRGATSPIHDLKIRAYKTAISNTGFISSSYVKEGTPNDEKFGELQLNFELDVHANDMDTEMWFTIIDPQVNGNSGSQYTNASMEITYIRLEIECMVEQQPYYNAFGRRNGQNIISLSQNITGVFGYASKIDLTVANTFTNVNLNNNSLPLATTGLAKIYIEADYQDEGDGQPQGLRIEVFKNGSPWLASQGVSNTNGTLIFDQTEPLGSNDELTFYIAANNITQGWSTNLRNVRGSVQFLDGEIKLVTFKTPTDLAHYVPDIKFGDVVDAAMQTGVIHMSVKPQENAIYMDYKEGIKSIDQFFDLTGKPFTPAGREFKGVEDELIIKYAINDGNQDSLQPEYSKIFFYSNFQWEQIEKVPKNFNGELIDLEMLPITQKTTYEGTLGENIDFLGYPITTLKHEGAGYIESDQSQQNSLSQIYFGMYDGPKYNDTELQAPAVSDTIEMDISLALNNPFSLLVRHMQWVELQDSASRKAYYTFEELTALPESYQKIIFKNQSHIWEQARVFFSVDEDMKVELLLR